jgi:hypothetical protein
LAALEDSEGLAALEDSGALKEGSDALEEDLDALGEDLDALEEDSAVAAMESSDNSETSYSLRDCLSKIYIMLNFILDLKNKTYFQH